MASRAPPGAAGLKRGPAARSCGGDWWWTGPRPVFASRLPRTPSGRARRTLWRKPQTFATPGQAGLPAEFKHINKRRKRNLQGFP